MRCACRQHDSWLFAYILSILYVSYIYIHICICVYCGCLWRSYTSFLADVQCPPCPRQIKMKLQRGLTSTPGSSAFGADWGSRPQFWNRGFTQWSLAAAPIWLWVKTYRYHYYSGMNIHFIPAMTWGSLGTRVLTHPHIPKNIEVKDGDTVEYIESGPARMDKMIIGCLASWELQRGQTWARVFGSFTLW